MKVIHEILSKNLSMNKNKILFLPPGYYIKRFCLSPKFVCDYLLGIVNYLGELAADRKAFVNIVDDGLNQFKGSGDEEEALKLLI